ncbi:hypothetical protein RFI_28466 [Reticulomyxa filosa]|uniref:Uncharacterized protein n=1 Tax=Reticulomyxa filosa TaxID=46433 RepID=X6M5N6_RETFI|nr:hypothetical protein RFI_28466 [Reticulomyxa filosa]|eukprot:ETO08921.1 hypothetical protein RFI_28466 [Reticulomyxa filosa]
MYKDTNENANANTNINENTNMKKKNTKRKLKEIADDKDIEDKILCYYINVDDFTKELLHNLQHTIEDNIVNIQKLYQKLKKKENKIFACNNELLKLKNIFGLDKDDDILQSIGHYKSPAITFTQKDNWSCRHIQSSNDLQTFRYCCDCGKETNAMKEFYYKKKINILKIKENQSARLQNDEFNYFLIFFILKFIVSFVILKWRSILAFL